MRMQCLDAGEAFWPPPGLHHSQKSAIKQVGLGFFHLSGALDGEYTKEDIKRRPAVVQRLFSKAVEIFNQCRMLIEELVDRMGVTATSTSAETSKLSPASPTSVLLSSMFYHWAL